MAVENISYSPNLLLTSLNDENNKFDNNTECCDKMEKENINQSILVSVESENIASNKCSRKGLYVSNNKVKNQISNEHESVSSEVLLVREPVNTSPSKKLLKQDSGIRATAKQVYPNIACLPVEENIIFCFLLSVWDDIVGPQAVYVWKKKAKLKKLKSFAYEKCAAQSSSYDTILDENSCKLVEPANRSSLRSSSEKVAGQNKSSLLNLNSVTGSSRRRSTSSENDGNKDVLESPKLCLSTVIQYVTEHTVCVAESTKWKGNKLVSSLLSVPQQNVIVFSVRFLILEEGVGVPYCLSAVIPRQDEPLLLPALNVFKEAMHRIAVKIRLFISKDGLSGGGQIRSDLQELCTMLSSLNKASLEQYSLGTFVRMPDDRRFAEKMLTSHFQTMGTSLVIADSPNEANKIVMWLGQFLPKEDRATSRISLSDLFWPFQPGVVVQAVIRSPNMSSSKLLDSMRPLTLIDLNSNSVRQMTPMNIHSKNSSATFRMQLMALWYSLDHAPAPSYSLFETVETPAPLVKRFLHEYDTLASCDLSVKKAYRETFMRSLYYMALAVITWTKKEWSKEKKKNDGKSIFQALCSAFNLEEADMKIILAFAESLQSGFLQSLFSKSAKE
ncbi:UNVERIFIED_CONTAM: hypothetical protein RMT77_012792 [Armadillidium vulgare]|nr:Protein C9orf72 [Armadillidium vulgare]